MHSVAAKERQLAIGVSIAKLMLFVALHTCTKQTILVFNHFHQAQCDLMIFKLV